MKARQPDPIQTAFRSGQPIDQAIEQAALSVKKTETPSSAKRLKQGLVQQQASGKR